jgi:hypothetical protein
LRNHRMQMAQERVRERMQHVDEGIFELLSLKPLCSCKRTCLVSLTEQLVQQVTAEPHTAAELGPCLLALVAGLARRCHYRGRGRGRCLGGRFGRRLLAFLCPLGLWRGSCRL